MSRKDPREPAGSLGFTRRSAVAGMAVTATGAIVTREAWAEVPAAGAGENPATILPSTNVCLLTPVDVEGPFYFDPKLERADITEGKPGVPLKLLLQVMEAKDCAAIEGARVDVWHCDAVGFYSGYEGQGDRGASSTEGQHFLRGTLVTNAAGQVTFSTIYPGWYPGRTPHIHFKVLLDEKSLLTGQIYFPDALSEFIYEKVSPYKDRKLVRDTANTTDFLVAEQGGRGSFCSIKEEADHYLASLVIGVARDGAARLADEEGDRPPPPGMAGTAREGRPPMRRKPASDALLVPGAKPGR